MNREADVCRFKNTVKYLQTERELDYDDIAIIAELNQVTIKKIVDAPKDDIPNLKGSTWAKVQDFNENYRDVVEIPVVGEAKETVDSFHFKNNGNGKGEYDLGPSSIKAAPAQEVKPMDDARWEALGKLVKAFGMKVTIDIKIE